MVGFTGSWNKRFHSGSLSDTIQQNCQVVQEAVAVQIELDLAKELSRIPCSAAVAETFVEILGRAVQRSQPNGTIEVTACVTSQGIEIEIADCGSDFAAQHTAFQRSSIHSGVKQQTPGVGVRTTRCPQGGMAWTIHEDNRKWDRKVA